MTNLFEEIFKYSIKIYGRTRTYDNILKRN